MSRKPLVPTKRIRPSRHKHKPVFKLKTNAGEIINFYVESVAKLYQSLHGGTFV